MDTPILDIKQIAKIFGVKETTVRTWARQKKIPAFKIGKGWFSNRSRLLEQQSIIDTKSNYDGYLDISHCKAYDVLGTDGRIEVKSSKQYSSKKTKFWHFTGLHKAKNSEFYLFLCYNRQRNSLLRIYKIATPKLMSLVAKINNKNSGSAFTIYSENTSLDKYIIYLSPKQLKIKTKKEKIKC